MFNDIELKSKQPNSKSYSFYDEEEEPAKIHYKHQDRNTSRYDRGANGDKPRYDRGANGDKPRYDRGANEDKPRYDRGAEGYKPRYDRSVDGGKPRYEQRGDRKNFVPRDGSTRSNNYGNTNKDGSDRKPYYNSNYDKNNERSNRNRPPRQDYKDNTTMPDENNDEENFLEQPAIKHQLLSYLYSAVEIAKYKYKILEYDADLFFLKETPYFVSPNYNGINGLMVFTRIRDKFFSFIVDRRTLSYNLNQLDLEKVKMIPINIRLNKHIYDGTILDGVLLYNQKNTRIKTFVINDVYNFCGRNLIGDFMNNKITNISAFMDTCYVDDDKLNSVNFVINKLYNLHEIKELVNSYIPKSKHSNSIKGLTFYPKISGTKLIYLYNNCTNSKIGESSPQAVQLMAPIEVRESNIDIVGEFTATFRMKKKDTVDVYQLYLHKKVMNNGKKFMKYEKFEIAYVPTKDCSYFCKDLFDKSGSDTVLVECKYLPDRKKWIPFKEAEKKKADEMDKIKAKLGITDDTEED
jgi:hypothetical protein